MNICKTPNDMGEITEELEKSARSFLGKGSGDPIKSFNILSVWSCKITELPDGWLNETWKDCPDDGYLYLSFELNGEQCAQHTSFSTSCVHSFYMSLMSLMLDILCYIEDKKSWHDLRTQIGREQRLVLREGRLEAIDEI